MRIIAIRHAEAQWNLDGVTLQILICEFKELKRRNYARKQEDMLTNSMYQLIC